MFDRAYTVRVSATSTAPDAGEIRGVTREEGVALVAGKEASWEPSLIDQDAGAGEVACSVGGGGETASPPRAPDAGGRRGEKAARGEREKSGAAGPQ